MNNTTGTKGLRSAGLIALQTIADNPGINTAELDRMARTARGGHQWMYRTVDRLIQRGLVRTGPARSGRGGGAVCRRERGGVMSRLELVRSDMGDGGWSMHVVGDEDDTPVLDGPSQWSEDEGWLRPDADDYDVAEQLVAAGWLAGATIEDDDTIHYRGRVYESSEQLQHALVSESEVAS